MVKLDSTVSTLLIAAAAAGLVGLVASSWRHTDPSPAPALAASEARPTQGGSGVGPWATSATGRVEPRDGEVRITAQTPGRIVEIPVAANDRVLAGDLLVRLDDGDALQRIVAADSEVDVRIRERDEEEAKGSALERRQAEDALIEAERSLMSALVRFDEAAADVRARKGQSEEVLRARERVAAARERLGDERRRFERLSARGDMPLPTRLEAAVTQARSDLVLAYNAYERTHIRAPFDGSVLSVPAKLGELAVASPEVPLVTFGDLAGLKVRAEVEDRDLAKVHVGQRVVIKADAFPDREFGGVVSSISSALGSPRIATRGPRRPNDVDVLEVFVDLEGTPPLLTGMRVDVFFRAEKATALQVN